MMDERDEKLKNFLKANQSKVPSASSDEWRTLNQRLDKKSLFSFLSFKILAPISIAAALIFVLLTSVPQANETTSTENQKIAEFIWNSYGYIDEMGVDSENDLYWDVEL